MGVSARICTHTPTGPPAHTRWQEHAEVRPLASPSNSPPGSASSSSNSTPPTSVLLRANLLALHPHHALYKLLLHLTCPSQLSIIDEWVALLRRLRAREGRERRAKSGPEGARRRRSDGYYLNKLTTPPWVWVGRTAEASDTSTGKFAVLSKMEKSINIKSIV